MCLSVCVSVTLVYCHKTPITPIQKYNWKHQEATSFNQATVFIRNASYPSSRHLILEPSKFAAAFSKPSYYVRMVPTVLLQVELWDKVVELPHQVRQQTPKSALRRRNRKLQILDSSIIRPAAKFHTFTETFVFSSLRQTSLPLEKNGVTVFTFQEERCHQQTILMSQNMRHNNNQNEARGLFQIQLTTILHT